MTRKAIATGRTVGEVSRLAGITVRTLHHYDRIGLVRPSGRSASGYRIYDERDLERLQQVLFYRELGFGLEEIRAIMAAPDFERGGALREQRKMLEIEAARLEGLIRAVDAAVDAHDAGISLTDEQLFEVFGDFDPRQYADEVRQRWGHTEAYRQSQQRALRFTQDDWRQVKAEGEEIARRFAQVMTSGEAASSPAADAVVMAHRRHLGRFYDCSAEMHRGLGELYVEDHRFTAYWDAYAPGLARFVHDAIAAATARETEST